MFSVAQKKRKTEYFEDENEDENEDEDEDENEDEDRTKKMKQDSPPVQEDEELVDIEARFEPIPEEVDEMRIHGSPEDTHQTGFLDGLSYVFNVIKSKASSFFQVKLSGKINIKGEGSMDQTGIITIPFTMIPDKQQKINSVIISQHGSISAVSKIESGVQETIDYLRLTDSNEDIAKDIKYFIQYYVVNFSYGFDKLNINLTTLFDLFPMDSPIGVNITTINYTPKLICGSATPQRRENDILTHLEMNKYMSIDFHKHEYNINARLLLNSYIPNNPIIMRPERWETEKHNTYSENLGDAFSITSLPVDRIRRNAGIIIRFCQTDKRQTSNTFPQTRAIAKSITNLRLSEPLSSYILYKLRSAEGLLLYTDIIVREITFEETLADGSKKYINLQKPTDIVFKPYKIDEFQEVMRILGIRFHNLTSESPYITMTMPKDTNILENQLYQLNTLILLGMELINTNYKEIMCDSGLFFMAVSYDKTYDYSKCRKPPTLKFSLAFTINIFDLLFFRNLQVLLEVDFNCGTLIRDIGKDKEVLLLSRNESLGAKYCGIRRTYSGNYVPKGMPGPKGGRKTKKSRRMRRYPKTRNIRKRTRRIKKNRKGRITRKR